MDLTLCAYLLVNMKCIKRGPYEVLSVGLSGLLVGSLASLVEFY